MLVPGVQMRAVLQPLLPDTQYKVTVTPVYTDGRDGISVSALGFTCKRYTPPNAHKHTIVLIINQGGELWATQLSFDKDAAPISGEHI